MLRVETRALAAFSVRSVEKTGDNTVEMQRQRYKGNNFCAVAEENQSLVFDFFYKKNVVHFADKCSQQQQLCVR